MRIVLLIVALLLVVAALAIDLLEAALEQDGAGTVKTVQHWGRTAPPYVIDAAATPTTVIARARTAPTIRTTVHSSSVGAPAMVTVDGTNWTDNKHAPPAGHWSGAINGSPCGGPDIPSCRRIWIESKGLATAYNPSGCGGRSCGGVAQFDPVTWIPGCTVSLWNQHRCGTYNGFQFAHLAPVDVQYTRMREVYAHGDGCGHWGADECVGVS